MVLDVTIVIVYSAMTHTYMTSSLINTPWLVIAPSVSLSSGLPIPWETRILKLGQLVNLNNL